jgi:hypothetical protein
VKGTVKKLAALAILAIAVVGCGSSDADVAAHNLSRAAEYFEVQRRIVFINGITDKYILSIEGRCSVETSESALGGALEVTCKTPDGQFKKHFLGLSDNVTFLVEQLEASDVSTQHYRVIFKPSVIIPDVELQ